MVRTRIAPSPTGYPHIATVYQALFDYAYAHRMKGKFIVRIEDTDRARFVPDAEEKLYEAFDWFHLIEDESPRKEGKFGPYKQSERLDLYHTYAQELLEKGHAYYCFCSKERLDEIREKQQLAKRPIMYDRFCCSLSQEDVLKKLDEKTPHVIRLKIPDNRTIIAKDEIRGVIEFNSAIIDDQVLVKADGYPTYHLAVVVDDHLMEITDVVRGEEWIPSLPKHVLLYEFFGWQLPKFYHTSVLRNPDKSKLSKRHGHTSVQWYMDEGFLPQAILNYIGLLGWSHPLQKEVFTLAEFTEHFDLKDMKAIGPIFDLEKLRWMNGEYIRMMTNDELKHALITFFTSSDNKEMISYLKNTDAQFIDGVMTLVKTRIKTLKEIENFELRLQEKLPHSEEEKEVIESLLAEFEQIEKDNWTVDSILTAMRAVMKKHTIKGKMLYKILTGKETGLPIPETFVLYGREKILAQLNQ